METVLTRIADLLELRGKGRSWLASEAGVGVSTINNWFSRGNSPNIKDLSSIAKVLGVSLDYLIDGKDYIYNENLTPTQKDLIDWVLTLKEEEAQVVQSGLTALKGLYKINFPF